MRTAYLKNISLTVILFFITVIAIAQNTNLKYLDTHFDDLNYKSRMEILQKAEHQKLSNKDKALYYYLLAHTHYANGKGAQALSNFLIAKELYEAEKDDDKVLEIELQAVEIKRLTENYQYKDYEYIIDDIVARAKKKNNSQILCITYKEIGNNFFEAEPQKALDFYKRALAENKKVKDSLFEANINGNIGLLYSEKLHQYELSKKHTSLAYDYFSKHQLNYYLANNYINQAALFLQKKKLDSAIVMYKKAEVLDIKDNNVNTRVSLYGLMSEVYKETKQYKKALEYAEKQRAYQKLNDDNVQVKAIRDTDVKYQTEERKSEIAWQKGVMKKGGVVIGLLLLVLIFLVLGYKNIQKKKKIVEQEKQIETQKLSSALKEQELNEIDKILEGQEKERIKIANDLHDDLGSVLATLKLNFQNLKQHDADNSTELYSKTDQLLEEAYQKVRGIAHTKNAGVIANQGLLTAINNIAEKVSIPGKLNVEVVAFGLEDRLENTLEVTIFRMIQEILTNAIKYAEASEITIHLTQHDDSLNIIIEDNGKGFDPKKTNKKDGMGLPNIEKKVEQIGGVFTIDSYQSRGTSIIIDLPL